MRYYTLIVALFATITLLLLGGCTTTDPYTGEQVVDDNATAALVGGLALGAAAAYAASSDDDDDDNDDYDRYHRHSSSYDRNRDRNYHRSSGVQYPASGVTCYDYQRNCYKDGHQSHRWTRRTYGS